jgi:HK97 family phage major capsid protein
MTAHKAAEELAAAKSIAETAATEGRAMTEAERADFDRHLTAGKDIKSATELMDAAAKLTAGTAEAKSAPRHKTAGAKFIADSKSWLEANSSADAKSILNSPAVEVGGIKTLITSSSDTSAGAALAPETYGLVSTTAYQYPLSILDLVSMSSTSNSAVQYAQIAPIGMGGSADAAGNYAQGEATNQSTLAFIKKLAAVQTTRAYVPASIESLADWGQLQGYIDNYLGFTVRRALENQIVSGDGEGENHTGLMNTSGVNGVAFDTDIVKTLRKAITAVEVAGNSEPTAIVLHPSDYEKLDMLAGSAGQYYFSAAGTPAGGSVPTFAGIARIKSRAVTPGTALVGDFKQAVLWERSPLTLSISNSHSDLFIKGAVAVLAQARAAFGVMNPAAFAVATIAD